MSFSILPKCAFNIANNFNISDCYSDIKRAIFLAMILFFSTRLPDALDGWLAKYFNLQFRLGSIQ